MENEIYVVIGIGLVLLFLLTVPTFSIGSGVGDINISDSNAVVDLNIFLTSDQNWLITPFIINQPSAGFTIPVPAALSDFSMRKSNRIVLDLNNASQYRIILDSNTPASGTAVNARIGLQFSDDNSIFYDANISSGGYLNLGATNAGPHPKYSDWIDINQTVNRPNIIYRLVTIDGNGSSFSIPLVQVQMRGPIRSNNFVTNNYTTSGGGGSGTTYTSGTPATIQVNNDLNTISQNFDGNFWSRASTLFPVPDVNLLDLSWTKLQNYPTGCGAFLAVQTIGDTISCISIPSEANIDANALAVVNALDLNNSLNYVEIDGDTMTGGLNAPDINVSNFHVDNNATIDKNLLVKQDTNINGQLGIDKNASLNTTGACMKFVSNGATICMCGNTFDANIGVSFYVC